MTSDGKEREREGAGTEIIHDGRRSYCFRVHSTHVIYTFAGEGITSLVSVLYARTPVLNPSSECTVGVWSQGVTATWDRRFIFYGVSFSNV